MTPDADIFSDTLALPASERAAFLATACGDAAQRERVETLLRAYDRAEVILAKPLGRPPAVLDLGAGTFVGRYKLLEKIGEGGCGVVWMAQQEEPVRRRVALKVIKLGMDTKEVIARFESERQALALMEHPNIAKIFEAGATPTGRPYFAMELVRGQPITRYCDERNLTTAQRLALFIRVCHAIQHAHERGVVHRDIKPSNILVTQEDGEPLPKVIDFGIAKAMQGRLTDRTLFTAFEQFIGTPAYMSPEQADFNANEVDARCDVYALGALLYELLAGCPPFDPQSLVAAGINEVRHIIREVDPPRPSTRLNTLDDAERTTLALRRGLVPAQFSKLIQGDLDWIVMKALEKNRARRYDGASALAADLQRHLGHQPVLARPPSIAYRSGKFVRRHRPGLTAAAVVSLALALGAAVSLQQSRRAARAERAAVAAEAKVSVRIVDPKSIAVLPFTNLSDDKESGYFADGVHEDILKNLAHIRELHVISRTSVMEYRGTKENLRVIAQKLGVAYILEGSVSRTGNKVRVTGQLIRAATDKHVWARSFDRDLTDVFAIQTELAQAIAGELKTALSPQEMNLLSRRPTGNPAAYDVFLLARAEGNNGQDHRIGLTKQEALYGAAVVLDPQFAAAWGELASTHVKIKAAHVDTTPARLAKATAAINRAVSLAPDSPEVILCVGIYHYFGLGDNVRGAEEFEKLIRLQPNDATSYQWLGLLAFTAGRLPEALPNQLKATQLDPGNFFYSGGLVGIYEQGRRFDEAIAEQRRIVALRPERTRLLLQLHGLLFRASGSTREADEYYAQLAAKEPESPLITEHHLALAERRGDYREVIRLDRLHPNLAEGEGPRRFQARNVAMAHRLNGDLPGAIARLGNFPADLRARLALEPDNTEVMRELAVMEAVAGRRDEALRHIRRAAELVPESKAGVTGDRFIGTNISEIGAMVAAWTDDKDHAITELARLLRKPSQVNVHKLKSILQWAPLRGDPRFEALVTDPRNNAPLF